MKGDFSRVTYSPFHNYISVLKQQGRVELDADWNEQAEIWSENFRQLAQDLFGEFAIPLAPNDITDNNSEALAISGFSSGPGGVFDFNISRGLAYIAGYQFWLPQNVTFRTQPDYPEPETPPADGDLLVYLETWLKALSYIDDELIREPALGGPDTCLRAKLVGQIKAVSSSGLVGADDAREFLRAYSMPGNLLLSLLIDESAHQIPLSFGEVDLGGGMIPGNLHYRIELHRGILGNGSVNEGVKWSDDNGAVVIRALKAIDSRRIIIEELEQITGESLKPGDWVEVTNLVTELHRQGGQMARIESLDNVSGGVQVTLDTDIHPILTRRKNGAKTGLDQGLGPRLRRWSGYISPLSLKTVNDLGRGVKAIFGSSDKKIQFEAGDYWVFAIRDRDYNKRFAPQKAAPRGPRKFRFPLAIIRREGSDKGKIIDCRKFIKPLAQ